ncbi:MAG TPA: cysteine desulfurase family protein [Methylovorus sp.]|nr:cysteine desulfurase family protein [Methylovorus sp.]
MQTATYFDHNGTTRLDSRVLERMLPFMTEQSGNATSRHSAGRTARQAIEQAREQVAAAVGAYPSQVVFTGSGTEADNLAIHGIAMANGVEQVLISAIEHPAVSRPAQALQWHGIKTGLIAADANGVIQPAALKAAISGATKPVGLVSVMLANNETGVIQPISELTEIARQHKAWVHTDAVQALGKISVDFAELNVHAMTLSSHKIHGPQGAGALILDKRVDIRPLLYGGGQEKGLRSGSENLAALVGFGMAAELSTSGLATRREHMEKLRASLEQGLAELGATLFGARAGRLPNTSFFAFDGIEGETLVMALDRQGFAVASGSACSSDSTEPSHVLMAMGVNADLARGSVRVSLGYANTMQEVDAFLLTLKGELQRLRKLTAIAV